MYVSEFYLTLNGEASAEITEKRSKFIGYVKNVNSEDAALEFLNFIRKKHSDATHNVYAYVLRNNNISRFSDDGEPAKTAGAPVLDVILKEGLTDVIIVVTRYFGGTLLGTGGLVKAYSKAAKEGINAAGIVKCTNCLVFLLNTPYNLWGKIENELNMKNCIIEETQFTDEVNVKAYCDKNNYNEIEKSLINATNGLVVPILVEERFFNIKI